jgi:hypothetical protein
MTEYIIVICRADRIGRPLRRVRWCASVTEASDSAVRWLRLHRNGHPELKFLPDQWVVAVRDSAVAFRIVASGGLDTLST